MSEEGGPSFPPDIGKSQIESGKEIVGQKPHCLFISGGQGTYRGIHGIKEGLEKQYGVGRVKTFNSAFNFQDPQNPNRFNEMADFIQEHAKEGLDIVAHSLGAAELKKAIERIKKREENFLDNKENTENLHIILISPSGFLKGIAGLFRFLERTRRFRSNTLLRGVDALTLFPPVGISSENLTLALRKAIPELSQYQENQEDFSLATVTSQENFTSYLPDVRKESIANYSEAIRSAIENRNYSGLRSLVKAYGKKLRKPLAEVFAGKFESEETPIMETTRVTMGSCIGGYLGLLDVLVKGFGSKTMEEIADLELKGVKLDLIIAEYDVFMRLKDAIVFFNGSSIDASRNVHMVQGVAHAFPALRPMGFGKIVSSL